MGNAQRCPSSHSLPKPLKRCLRTVHTMQGSPPPSRARDLPAPRSSPRAGLATPSQAMADPSCRSHARRRGVRPLCLPLPRHDPELGHITAQRVHRHGTLIGPPCRSHSTKAPAVALWWLLPPGYIKPAQTDLRLGRHAVTPSSSCRHRFIALHMARRRLQRRGR